MRGLEGLSEQMLQEIYMSCLVALASWLQHTPGMAPHLPCSSPTPPHQPSPQAAFYPHCASPQGFCVLVSWPLATQPGRTQGLSTEGEKYPVGSSPALLSPSPSEPPLIFPIPLCQCSQHHAHGTPLDFCPRLLPAPAQAWLPPMAYIHAMRLCLTFSLSAPSQPPHLPRLTLQLAQRALTPSLLNPCCSSCHLRHCQLSSHLPHWTKSISILQPQGAPSTERGLAWHLESLSEQCHSLK